MNEMNRKPMSPAVPASFAVVMTDASHDPETVTLARAAAALWGASLAMTEAHGWNWADTCQHAHAAMVDVVLSETCRTYIDDECFPHALTLDGLRFIAIPDPDSTSNASATLIVEDAATGQRIAFCPGQWAELPAVA